MLDAMPDTGRVLVAHPSRAWQARDVARYQLVDIFYTAFAPPTHVYVLNIDQAHGYVTAMPGVGSPDA